MTVPRLSEAGAVLAAVKPAVRRLRRWPAARLDRGCARRLWGCQAGTKKRLALSQTKKLHLRHEKPLLHSLTHTTGLRINAGMATQSTEHEKNNEDNYQQSQDSSEATSPIVPLAMAIEAAATK
jgi:hypothetical protein